MLFDFLLTGDVVDGFFLSRYGHHHAIGATLRGHHLVFLDSQRVDVIVHGVSERLTHGGHLLLDVDESGVLVARGRSQVLIVEASGVVAFNQSVDALVVDSGIGGDKVVWACRVDIVLHILHER